MLHIQAAHHTISNKDLSNLEEGEGLELKPRGHCEVQKMDYETKYETMGELGKGMFGVVKKCREKDTGSEFAAKIVRKTAKTKKEVTREIAMMNRLHHKRLAQIHEAFETSKQMIIIMEYIPGEELFEKVVQDDMCLTEGQVVRYMKQILYGVHHMHKKSIVHLDLKPENILCIHGGEPGYEEIKLIDFGLAREIKPGSSETTMCGTPEFVSPEVIAFEPVSVASDMWSIGVVTYVLLSGNSPFLGDDDTETLQNVTAGEYDFEDEDDCFLDVSEKAKLFIQSLLMRNPKERMTVEDCLHHDWLKSCEEEKVLDTSKLKKYLARRKWKKTINAIKAVGRFSLGLAALRKKVNIDKQNQQSGHIDQEITTKCDMNCNGEKSPIVANCDTQPNEKSTAINGVREKNSSTVDENNNDCVNFENSKNTRKCEQINKHIPKVIDYQKVNGHTRNVALINEYALDAPTVNNHDKQLQAEDTKQITTSNSKSDTKSEEQALPRPGSKSKQTDKKPDLKLVEPEIKPHTKPEKTVTDFDTNTTGELQSNTTSCNADKTDTERDNEEETSTKETDSTMSNGKEKNSECKRVSFDEENNTDADDEEIIVVPRAARLERRASRQEGKFVDYARNSFRKASSKDSQASSDSENIQETNPENGIENANEKNIESGKQESKREGSMDEGKTTDADIAEITAVDNKGQSTERRGSLFKAFNKPGKKLSNATANWQKIASPMLPRASKPAPPTLRRMKTYDEITLPSRQKNIDWTHRNKEKVDVKANVADQNNRNMFGPRRSLGGEGVRASIRHKFDSNGNYVIDPSNLKKQNGATNIKLPKNSSVKSRMALFESNAR